MNAVGLKAVTWVFVSFALLFGQKMLLCEIYIG